jgi:DNA repair ATPase RecN
MTDTILQRKYDELKKQYDIVLSKLEHKENRLKNLRARDVAIDDLSEKHCKELEELEEQHEKMLEKIESRHEKEIEKLNSRQLQEVEQLENRHEHELEKLSEKYVIFSDDEDEEDD